MKQKEIDAEAIMMPIFLTGLALNFDADFHDLEEITSELCLKSKRRFLDESLEGQFLYWLTQRFLRQPLFPVARLALSSFSFLGFGQPGS